jgi:hypothetical protein
MAKAPKKDLLDRLAEDGNRDPRLIIGLMLWQDRHRNPEMARQITERDLRGFTDGMTYLEVTPDVVIVRPQGRPAQEAIPAQGKRRAVSARPAEPARPFVAVNLVRKGTMDSIKPIENNEEDARLRDQAAMVTRWRDKAPGIARELLAGIASGTYSTATMQEAVDALTALARA